MLFFFLLIPEYPEYKPPLVTKKFLVLTRGACIRNFFSIFFRNFRKKRFLFTEELSHFLGHKIQKKCFFKFVFQKVTKFCSKKKQNSFFENFEKKRKKNTFFNFVSQKVTKFCSKKKHFFWKFRKKIIFYKKQSFFCKKFSLILPGGLVFGIFGYMMN